MDNKGFFAIIPSSVRYDKSIPPAAKLLYAEITATCDDAGVCWAKNEYFCELYGASMRSVQLWISALVDAGYLVRSIQYAEDGKTILNRCLALGNIAKNIAPPPCRILHDPHAKIYMTPMQKFTPPHEKNCAVNIESNIKENIPPLSPMGGNNQDPLAESSLSGESKQSLQEWIEYKRERRQAYKPQGIKALVAITEKKAREYGDQAVVDIIVQSMASGYQGIMWDRLKTTSAAPQQRQRRVYE